jgi:hypothetical protein
LIWNQNPDFELASGDPRRSGIFCPKPAFYAGLAAAAYLSTPRRKPLCGLGLDQNLPFLHGPRDLVMESNK